MTKKLTKKATKTLKNIVKAKTVTKQPRIITVKNADGDADTTATILIQNKIKYTPKVSVIIPVYNVEEYLRECLDSVINQTLNDIEIICVDDGSTDKSLEILKEYAARDNRITVITQQNLHAGVARNAGLTIARGEYLSFLDSDDFFELNMLEETYNTAQENNSDIVVYKYKNLDNATKETSEPRGINIKTKKNIETFSTNNLSDNLFMSCNPMPWNKLFKHKIVTENALRFQSLTACNDVYFSLSSMAFSKTITYMDKSFVFYRHNRQDSLRNSRDKYPINFYIAYSELFNTLQKNQILNQYAQTFINSFVSSALWTLDNTNEKRAFVKDFIKSTIYPKYIKNYETFLSDTSKSKLTRITSPDLIISLTSYPARIGTVNQTIESLLNQNMKADKVILWLAPEQFPHREKDLPKQLLDLRDRGLTIDWYHDIRSYKKLIPTLQKYPDAIIVTADDDLIYPNFWLNSLYSGYMSNPGIIWCHRAHGIKTNDTILPYNQWQKDIQNSQVSDAYTNFCTTGGGVLYPPKSFYKDVLQESIFMKLTPNADDIWFWAMLILNNKKIKTVSHPMGKLVYVNGTQETALWKTNLTKNGNDTQIANLIKKYPKILKILIPNKQSKPRYIKAYIFFPYYLLANVWMKRIYIPILKFRNHTRAILYSHSHHGKIDTMNAQFNKIATTVQSGQANINKQIENLNKKYQELQMQNISQLQQITDVLNEISESLKTKNKRTRKTK